MNRTRAQDHGPCDVTGSAATSQARRLALAVAPLAVVVLVAGGCSSGAPPTTRTASVSSSTASPTSSPRSSASPGAVTGAGTSSSAGASQQPAPVESNPPGDIPDNIAYVTYRNAVGRYGFAHPEGWASTARGARVSFTDKLNGIAASAAAATTAPTSATAKAMIATLSSTQPAFELRSTKTVSLPGGTGLLIVFRRNSAPDAVTGKVFRDEVNRYVIYRAGRQVTLDLFGAVGSDNVDPYTKISTSLRLL